jgi:hypothetical protein
MVGGGSFAPLRYASRVPTVRQKGKPHLLGLRFFACFPNSRMQRSRRSLLVIENGHERKNRTADIGGQVRPNLVETKTLSLLGNLRFTSRPEFL